MMDPACSTATTRPLNRPGIPNLLSSAFEETQEERASGAAESVARNFLRCMHKRGAAIADIMMQAAGNCSALFEGNFPGVVGAGAPDPGHGQLEAGGGGVAEEIGGRKVWPAGVAPGDTTGPLGIEFSEADGEAFGVGDDAFFEETGEVGFVAVVMEGEEIAVGVEERGPAAHPTGGHAADGELGARRLVDGFAGTVQAVGHVGEGELMGVGDIGTTHAGGGGKPVFAAAHDHFRFVDEFIAEDVGMIGDEVPKRNEDVADEGFKEIGMAEGVTVALLDYGSARKEDGVEGEGVIEEDEEDGDAVAYSGGEGFADGRDDAGFETGGPFAREADTVPAVAEDEPTDHAKARGGDFGEISVEEGGAVRGFEAEGGGGRRAEVPTVVEAEVEPHLERSAFGDAIRHIVETVFERE